VHLTYITNRSWKLIHFIFFGVYYFLSHFSTFLDNFSTFLLILTDFILVYFLPFSVNHYADNLEITTDID
jgi:hypothetical protein